MKATETKSTHSQQHSTAETSFFSKEQESSFFLERSPELHPFFPAADTSSFIQPKYTPEHQPFFQPTAVPLIQAKCAACEAEEQEQQAETPIVQRMPAFESEVQPEGTEFLQRMPAFESENETALQTKPLSQHQEETEAEDETGEEAPIQAKLASGGIEPPDESGENTETKGSGIFAQTKLKVGHPNDRYEREADTMADQIVVQPKQRSTIAPTLQTKPIAKVITIGRQHPLKLRAKLLQGRPSLQRQGDGSLSAGEDIPTRLQSARGKGSRLDDTTRSRMESSFGADFSGVRVHTDSEATQLNQDLGAQAFTHGSDIYFNEGKYNPASRDGEHLLAHELTHTVQQGASTRLKPAEIQRQEADNEDLKELKEADRDQKAAVDPTPAEQARQEAEQEAAEAEQNAEEKAPAATSDKEKGKGEKDGKAKARIVEAKPRKPDRVKPSTPEEEPKGEVGQDLDQQSAGVCNQGAEKAQQLADNQQAHDEAGEKLNQTESAVEPPTEEGQSRSNAGQVEALDQTPAPTTDPGAAQRERDQAIAESVPTTIEGMNKFESEGKAKVVGSRVLAQTSQEVGQIQGTYSGIETPPPAAEPEPSEALPEMEVAPETPQLNLGEGAVPELTPEQTDASEFDQQSDELLNKEGISQEQLDMVDSGDLAEANKDRKDLKQKVKDQPAEIQTFAKQRQGQVKADMQNEEAKTRSVMQQKRQKELGNSQKTQQETKSKLELKREEVTKNINKIYETAKQKVTTKLENLEKSSLKRFDQGQAKYSKLFEREVKRDINAWKRDRYSGFLGGIKWLKDKIVGIDGFPEVKQAFSSARERYVQRIDQLIAQINKDNNQVIEDCKAELEKAKQQIKEYVDGLGPELKKTGQAAMKDMQAKLKEMDGFINKKKEELQQKLCDKKDEAIKAIDKKIEQMKSEMGGLLGKLGKLLLKAMVKFFKWAIKKIGGNSDQLMGVLNKGESVIQRIVKDPIAFFKNVAKAVGGGINRFVANIKQHLIKGLIGWLTGAMGDAGLQLPEKFDLKGIFSLMLQILGLTWTSIRTKLAKRVGEKVVAAAEKGVDIIKRVVTEGPIALWNIIKEKAGEIKAQVMEGIRNWAIAQIVKKATIKLLSMLNPVGAIVQAIIAIYDVVMFFIENWDRIVAFVKSIFSSIGEIAMGQIGKAAAFIEKALAMTIPIILSFLARFLGLSGIGKAIRNVMAKVRKPVDKVVDKIVGFLAKQVKKLFGKGANRKPGNYTQKDKTKAKQAVVEEEKKQAKDGRVSSNEAQKTAQTVKRKHPVFKSLTPVLNKDTWNYTFIFRKPSITTPLPADTGKKKEKIAQYIKESHLQAKSDLNKDKDAIIADPKLGDNPSKEDFKKVAIQKAHGSKLHTAPIDTGHKFGQVLTNKIEPRLKNARDKALKAIGDKKSDKYISIKDNLSNKEKRIKSLNRRRPQIHKGEKTYKTALVSLQETIFEPIQENPALDKLEDAFEKLLKEESEPAHAEFKPVILATHVDTPKKGKTTVDYKYASGSQKFSVVYDSTTGIPNKITGENLSAHSLGTGVREGETFEGHNRAHLIANEIRGSGYRTSHNLIVTSKVFNQKVMRDTERDLGQQIDQIGNVQSFNLTVEVSWADPQNDVPLADVKAALQSRQSAIQGKSGPGYDAERGTISALLALDDASLDAKLKAKIANIDKPRCMNVEYVVKSVQKADGTKVDNPGITAKTGPDELYGT